MMAMMAMMTMMTMMTMMIMMIMMTMITKTSPVTPLLQHPQLMSGCDPDERKANALKQSLDYIDIFLDKTSYCAGDQVC